MNTFSMPTGFKTHQEGRLAGKVEFYNVQRSYMSSKVARVRWSPDCEHFLTGGYGEPTNRVELWHFPRGADCAYGYPKLKDSITTNGDVNEIKFVDGNRFLFSTTTSELHLVQISNEKMEIVETWDGKYFVGDSIYGFDISDESTVAVITSEGIIACFSLANRQEPSATVGSHKDNIECVSFLTNHELAQGNLRGQLTVWDLRLDLFKPAMSFAYNRDSTVGVTCIQPFPVRKHMLVASGMDGSVTTWDLRKPLMAETVYEAHSKPVTSMVFHQARPSNLFTTSMSGEVWHWTNFLSLLGEGGTTVTMFNHTVTIPPPDNKPDVVCLIGKKKFPTNSCDVIEDRLVCSTDNDCLVFVQPLQLK
ncbi:nucleoporin Nup43 [Cimex lectularius]|uniref:Uncharacterized protein n=1 Tax=Cimex lectularius TaxID=79782 RepID=A0A8I6RSX3_CIMLE|nr:nucleoporin Nup43 [Cimex lectularius]